MEKWIVLTPRVEESEPLFEAGWSSARRNPVWRVVGEGAKMDASLSVTSTGIVAFLSNCFTRRDDQLREMGKRKGRRTREPVMFGSCTTLLHVRSARGFSLISKSTGGG